MSVRIVLIDDHLILRDGLRMILQRESDLTVIGETSDARGGLECVRKTAPDLVLMDLQLPDEDGLSCTRRILAERPGTKVLVLSGSPDPRKVEESLRAGASGYVLKDEAAAELVRAVRQVMEGKVHLSPAASGALVGTIKAGAVAAPATARLSERELAVLKLLGSGLRNKEIADRLSIGTKSVETYRSRLMRKLDCGTPAELVRYGIREGLIDP